MLDTSKQSFAWNLVLFTPTLVAFMVATLDARAIHSQTALVCWGIFNAVCALLCAHAYAKATLGIPLRCAKTFGLSLMFWILNAGMSFFGGCACAIFAGGR